MGNAWYGRGFNDDRMNESRFQNKGPSRLWLPNGAKAPIIFLDSEGFNFWEHQLKIAGDWRNWFTCRVSLGEEEACALCDNGEQPYYVSLFTILDLSEWETRQGQKRRLTKRIFPAKKGTYDILKNLAEKRGGLAGCQFEAIRAAGDKTPSVGSMFDFERKWTRAEIMTEYRQDLAWINDLKPQPGAEKLTVEKFLSPYDYAKLFAPMDNAELVRVLRRMGRANAGAGARYDEVPPPSRVEDDDSIPFMWAAIMGAGLSASALLHGASTLLT